MPSKRTSSTPGKAKGGNLLPGSGTGRGGLLPGGSRRERGGSRSFSTRDFSVDQSVNLMSGDYRPASASRSQSGSIRGSISGLFKAETSTHSRSASGRIFDEFDASAATESEEYLGNIRRRRLNPFITAVNDCCDSVGFGGKVSLCCVLIGCALLGFGIYAVVQSNPHNVKEINAMKKIIVGANVTPASVFKSAGNSPQKKALVWIASEDQANLPRTHEALLERYILAVFYFGSKPDKWISSNNWLTSAGHCSWHGVECVVREDVNEESGVSKTYDDDDHITAINLPSNGMEGTIPPEFGRLSNTITLDLSDNDMGGELPDFHSNLKYLILRKNALIGTIPSSITEMTNLHGIDLSMNRLEGSLPENIGILEELRFLMVSENLLSGTFPEIPNMLKMTKLHLDGNSLDGSLPEYIQQFTRLSKLLLALSNHPIGNGSANAELSVAKNKLEGPFPEELLRPLNKLEVLKLGDNRFTGTIPDIFDYIHRLRDLHLNNNRFEGTIPKSLGNLSAMTTLRLDTNRLTGTIPNLLVIMADMEAMALNDNIFTGTIPTVFGFFDDIVYLSLKNNQLSGPIPTQFGELFRLADLHLQNNKLTGEIPTELGQLDLLSKLSLEKNDFVNITVPSEVCNLVANGDMTALSADCNEADKVFCDCCHSCFPLL
eukprot:scaffold5281_cov127-Cylindrotheca_fusiformis.AAC.8